jgi:hypothetical protein
MGVVVWHRFEGGVIVECCNKPVDELSMVGDERQCKACDDRIASWLSYWARRYALARGYDLDSTTTTNNTPIIGGVTDE